MDWGISHNCGLILVILFSYCCSLYIFFSADKICNSGILAKSPNCRELCDIQQDGADNIWFARMVIERLIQHKLKLAGVASSFAADPPAGDLQDATNGNRFFVIKSDIPPTHGERRTARGTRCMVSFYFCVNFSISYT